VDIRPRSTPGELDELEARHQQGEANVNGGQSLWLRGDAGTSELPVTADTAAALLGSGATASRRQALIVNDQTALRASLMQLHLGLAGFHMTNLADGAKAIAVGRTMRFDVIVLDIASPSVDGITVCQALRAEGPNVNTPILMLNGRGTESDQVAALATGADDYITKPFRIRDLMARIDALLRRHNRTPQSSRKRTELIERRGVLVNVEKRTAIANGQRVDLTKQEFELLHVLMSRPGIVFSREALLSKVWGGNTHVIVRTVDAVISRLRRKLEVTPHAPELILTVWGVGYKCADVD
jgi:DNA-binding response OmpR family regulator